MIYKCNDIKIIRLNSNFLNQIMFNFEFKILKPNYHYCKMLLTRHYDQRPIDETVCDALIANGDVKNVKTGAKCLRWRIHQTRFIF